jgi:hypothetical protein
MAKKYVVSAEAETLIQAISESGLIRGLEEYDAFAAIVTKKAKSELAGQHSYLTQRLRQRVRDRLARRAKTYGPVFTSVGQVEEAYVLPPLDLGPVAPEEEHTAVPDPVAAVDRFLRVAPGKPPESPVEGNVEHTEDLFDAGIGIEDESSLLGVNERPLRQELQEYLDRIRFGVNPGVSLLAKRHTLGGRPCFLVCTWYIETEKMIWNLMGQLQDSDLGTDGISPARCEADKILYDISRPVKVTGKTLWKEWTLPAYEGDFPGQTFHNVTASWAVFALVFPQPQFYRLWLNEQRRGGGRKGDLSRRLYDLMTGKKIKS